MSNLITLRATRELLSTSVEELQGLRRGDIVRTPTGKCDRVIVSLSRANTPEERTELARRADAAGGNGPLGQRYDVVKHRALRSDGRAFGPVMGNLPGDLKLVSR